jgi:hypothetical protein
MFLLYNHARRLQLLSLELSIEAPAGFVKNRTSGSRWRFQKRNGRDVTVSEVKRLKVYNGYGICNGHFPADTVVRSGVTVDTFTALPTGMPS